jgi:hypothetical protein
MATRKKQQTRPWFLIVGIALVILGLGGTGVYFFLKGTSAPKAMQIEQVQQIQVPMVKGGESIPQAPVAPLVSVSPEDASTWIDVISKALDKLVGLLIAGGGATMVWLNVRERKKELSKTPK